MLSFLTPSFDFVLFVSAVSSGNRDFFPELPDNLRIPLYFIVLSYKIESGIVTSHRHSITIISKYF